MSNTPKEAGSTGATHNDGPADAGRDPHVKRDATPRARLWKHGGIPVVDGHVHVNRFDLMKPGPRRVIEQNPGFAKMVHYLQDPDAFVALLDEEGIWQAWLVNYCAKEVLGYGWEVNAWIGEYTHAHPERLVAVGGYDPRETADGAPAVDHLRNLGVRALKIHPVHQHLSPDAHRDGTKAGRRLGAVYRRAEELRMPVIFHTGTSVFPGADNRFGNVAPIEAVLEDHPELPVILAHGGRPDQCREALELVAAFPKAWLDVSSLPPKRIPEWFGDLDAPFPDGYGERTTLGRRTLWGSDWPGPKVPGMGANVEAFLGLGLGDETNRAVLHDNAQKILAQLV